MLKIVEIFGEVFFFFLKGVHRLVPQVMSQAEGQQKNLVHSIDSLPARGPLSCLDQDLLLLKATSAATLSCLGECLNILQQTQSHGQAPPQSSERSHAAQRAPSGESALGLVPVLPLEPPTSPSPLPLFSFQPPPPPELSAGSKVQQLDCDFCPCLMATMNFSVCSKCCWMWPPQPTFGVPSSFVPFVVVLWSCSVLFLHLFICLFNVINGMSRVPANGSAKSMPECQVSMNMDQSSVLFTEPFKSTTECLLACMLPKKRKNDQGFVCVNEWT